MLLTPKGEAVDRLGVLGRRELQPKTCAQVGVVIRALLLVQSFAPKRRDPAVHDRRISGGALGKDEILSE